MRTRSVSLPILLLAAFALLGAACGSDDGVDAGGTPDEERTPATDGDEEEDTPDDPEAAGGTLMIGLEEVQGFFTEGFEVGLRIEQADGTVIAAWLWSDVVEEFGDGTARAFYETVLEESVPAGTLVVLATVNVGMGPAPEVPDLEGELDCRIKVEIPDGGEAVVEVDFSGTQDCLRQVS